jgi:hypothetical protein
MNARLDAAVAAIRAELARQAAEGGASYRGVRPGGRDGLSGDFDLAAVGRAVLRALGEVRAADRRPTPDFVEDHLALSIEADERQTERMAPNDASPGEAGGEG